MKLLKNIFWIAVLSFTIMSCQKNRLKVDISGIESDLEFVRFGQELFSIQDDTLAALERLHNTYPDFFNLFTYRIINVGGIEDSLFKENISTFLTDTMILHVKKFVDEQYDDIDDLKKQINKSFKYYQYHFPNKELPVIYTYISGFNQSVVIAEEIVGISLDKYLGRDNPYYKLLNTTPVYKARNMHRDKIPSDVAYAWGMSEYSHELERTSLLDNMIHHGKLMYFTEAMLPKTPDSLLIGYTADQIKWVKNNEAQMWTYLVEKKMLYSNKRMDIIRYINDSPYTTGFPLESPGRTGVWLGWQIVRSYMDKHPDVPLKELMENTNYQAILNASEYYPE